MAISVASFEQMREIIDEWKKESEKSNKKFLGRLLRDPVLQERYIKVCGLEDYEKAIKAAKEMRR